MHSVLSHTPWPFTIYIYIDGSWAMAEQYWMKNEMLDVLRMKLWAWGTYWGNDGNTLRRKENPTPNPKDTKTCPPDCMLSLPIGLHESFILKTVDYHLQLGYVYVQGMCGTTLATSTLIILFSEILIFKNYWFQPEFFLKEIKESSEIFCFLKWKFQN
jgi:hypothetical protein